VISTWPAPPVGIPGLPGNEARPAPPASAPVRITGRDFFDRKKRRPPPQTASVSTAEAQRVAKEIAADLGTTNMVTLETASAGLQHAAPGRQWSGPVYVARAHLLTAFGITSSEVNPHAGNRASSPSLTGTEIRYCRGARLMTCWPPARRGRSSASSSARSGPLGGRTPPGPARYGTMAIFTSPAGPEPQVTEPGSRSGLHHLGQAPGMDLTLGRTAVRVTEPTTLERVAGIYRDIGWPRVCGQCSEFRRLRGRCEDELIAGPVKPDRHDSRTAIHPVGLGNTVRVVTCLSVAAQVGKAAT
jgi:hypothetical protein